MLVRTRHDLIEHRIAVHNQLVATLRHNFPGAIGLFSKLDIAISLAFLRRFPSEAKAAWLTAGGGELRMAHWLRANGYSGRHTPRELVDHLTHAAVGRVEGAAAEAGELIVLTLVDTLVALRHPQGLLETRIREALLAHPAGRDWRLSSQVP